MSIISLDALLFHDELLMMLWCRVLSLSDRRYSLNPLSQTRIDWV